MRRWPVVRVVPGTPDGVPVESWGVHEIREEFGILVQLEADILSRSAEGGHNV